MSPVYQEKASTISLLAAEEKMKSPKSPKAKMSSG
jgi:hypothetical protein